LGIALAMLLGVSGSRLFTSGTRRCLCTAPAAVVGRAAGDKVGDDPVGFVRATRLLKLLVCCRPIDLVAVEGALFEQLEDGLAYVWRIRRWRSRGG